MNAASASVYEPYRGLYLHIPFCASKCAYCDFDSKAVQADSSQIDEYIDQLILDIRHASKRDELSNIETVYIGGGTPSYVGQAGLSKLLYSLSLSMHLRPEIECSMEANPESLHERMVRDIWALGVNRLSIGVQSFDDSVLATLGRVHDARCAKRAVLAAQTRFDNVSIDLMCGIPGQSLSSLEASIEQAISLEVKHISVYPLSIEEGTLLDRQIKEGLLSYPNEDESAEHMTLARDMLESAGYVRYEVASYARPHYECKHNISYWSGIPYLGLGSAAVSMRQNAEIRERLYAGKLVECLDASQVMAEDLMLGMRLACGLSDEQVNSATLVFDELPSLLGALVAEGFLVYRDARFQPTDLGWLCGNELYGRLLELAP